MAGRAVAGHRQRHSLRHINAQLTGVDQRHQPRQLLGVAAFD
ncbi:hypothetical protein ACFPH6_04835 [Streptomyces xiangluensis]|jgi:hypothetical protein|uniref:Uncharacterized protein n=1 Tax=Streptomyces xiangluensis TaxID=2665720 RepID=A0ABV8YJ62_9ACTN